MLVTRFGVSVLKVVATIDTPINHHGADRPEVKNSAVLEPARLASRTAGKNEIAIDKTTMTQSRVVTCICRSLCDGAGKQPQQLSKLQHLSQAISNLSQAHVVSESV
jgi:hypothetical protein